RVVLTFARCAAYAADQDAGSTAVGWAESFASSSLAQQAALSACSSRGGTGCLARVWGCNGPVVEQGLGLDRAARQQIQRGLEAAGFDPDGADGLFGPRTRAAIRAWQTSRGSRATGYLDRPALAALRPSALGQPTFRQREPAGANASVDR
ncbi:MAG: peptidoglycan-binding protein, partial [Acidobacteriota bacterium]|nr:peptidoglycan-binding protein [Acidobacteriota bacterium]